MEHDEMQARGRVSDRRSEDFGRPKLLIVSRIFGASGQPWLHRQVVGVRGFKKELLCWDRQNPATQPVENISLHVLSENPAPYDGAGRWWHRTRNLPGQNFYAAVGREKRHLAELLRRNRPDVILCYFGDIAMRLLPVARQADIPVVAYLHGDFQFLLNRWYRWSLRQSLQTFAAIVVVTQMERQWILEQGVPESKVFVIPCGAPTTLFQPNKAIDQSEALRFVMVSRLAAEKGCDLSIRAFAAIASRMNRAELGIYGDGPTREQLQKLVKKLGLTQKVFFHGYVEEQTLAEALASHDIFIQHSLCKEGSPVSIVEAMACGLPVVATPVGGIVDQVVDGKTGFLVAEGDVQGMATAMWRLACDSQLRLNFGQAGLNRAKQFYDSSTQTNCLRQLLSSITSQVTCQPVRLPLNNAAQLKPHLSSTLEIKSDQNC